MNWLTRLRGKPGLETGHRAALNDYRSIPRPDTGASLAAERLVAVDVETSGLNPFNDRLISIGAVAVTGGLVRFDRSFNVLLRQERPSARDNILVHGIGESAQLAGREPSAGLLDFLLFAGKAPLVGFNADFDRVMIERATIAAIGIKPDNVWLDLAFLAPATFPYHAKAKTLDDWMMLFGIENYARHDAVADALATAQLLLVVLAQARKQGMTTIADLMRLERGQRWLGR
jgi:DNA polymerase-3 subunit epsilon